MDGDTFVIFTTQTGGKFHIEHATREQYDEAVKVGEWKSFSFSSSVAAVFPLKMIAFLRVEDNHDFVLGGSRDKPDTWHEQFRAA